MTKENLKKANDYAKQIYTLKNFIQNTCWQHRIILRHPKFKVETWYGAGTDYIEVDKELAKRIIDVINDYISELEKELDEM